MLTTAVAIVVDSSGKELRLVGSSRRTLNRAQRAALRPGEVPVAGAGHAEITVLNAASHKQFIVKAVASTRPVCTECRKAIEAASAEVIEPKSEGHWSS